MGSPPPLCSVHLSPEISPIHPNHDIKFPSWPQRLGRFQGDINTNWKMTAGMKTVLDPTSDTARTQAWLSRWGLAAARTHNPKKPLLWARLRRGHWPCRQSVVPCPLPWPERGLSSRAGCPQSLPSLAPPSPPAGHSSNHPPPGRSPIHHLSWTS